MTVISDVIQQAFRESDLIDETNYPTPTQMSEALSRLNSIVQSVLGFEVGEQLLDWRLGSYNQTDPNCEFPYQWDLLRPIQNSRLIVTNEQPQTVYLPVKPDDGARIAVNDPFGILSTVPITLDGNGRAIEGSNSILLDTDNLNRVWMYRSDLAGWVVLNKLTDASQEMPFPEEFDDYFIGTLAMRINPRHKGVTSGETVSRIERVKRQLQARYRQHREMPSELGLWISPWYSFGYFPTGRV